ncbi:unnamed protein product, partial [Polarella glacialis]
VRLRRYVHESMPAQRQTCQEDLLRDTISEGLQREVALHSANTNLLQGLYWADNFEPEARMEMVKAFRPKFFGPNEVLMLRHCVLVIQKGILAVRGRILRRGDAWGIECILFESDYLIESAQPRSLSYASVMCLFRDDLLAIARAFPSVDGILRRAQVRAAVRRALFLHATISEQNQTSAAKLEPATKPDSARNAPVLQHVQTRSSFSGHLSQADATTSWQLGQPIPANVSNTSIRTAEMAPTSCDVDPTEEDGTFTTHSSKNAAISPAVLQAINRLEAHINQKQDQILSHIHELGKSTCRATIRS